MANIRATVGSTVKIPVYMVDATDGFTPETGVATPTKYISKNGATPVVPSDGAFAELHASNMPGHYTMQLDGDDTDTPGMIQGNVIKSGTTRNYPFVVFIDKNFRIEFVVNIPAGETTAEIYARLIKNNTIITAPFSCAAEIYDKDGGAEKSITTANFGAADSQGKFKYDWASHTLVVGGEYTVDVTIVDNDGEVSYVDTVEIKVK